jgi:hypothetical protein
MMLTKGQTNKRKRGSTVTKVCPTTEWTDFHGILLLFGLRRSTAYHLVNSEPALKGASISLKGADEIRGKRLFNVAKFRAFLESKQVPSRLSE